MTIESTRIKMEGPVYVIRRGDLTIITGSPDMDDEIVLAVEIGETATFDIEVS